ncbi:hypothetical protein [Bradyrhizobium japonicum]|uniref:hypothetical protein n=1 Tax=Bradyrhizobium japonicum TaxID=375 RepID=UPI0020137C3A|nr:hypothetical protein [Bradyrhizobium japonicum]
MQAEQGQARALDRAEPAAQVRDLGAAAILQPRPAVKGRRAARNEGRPVARTLVSKSDLELIGLQEIRHVSGGELVISVEIEHGDAEPDGLNWRLLVIAKDGADLDRLQNAATTTSHLLKRRYQLIIQAGSSVGG